MVDKPTCDQSIRGLVNSRTGRFVTRQFATTTNFSQLHFVRLS